MEHDRRLQRLLPGDRNIIRSSESDETFRGRERKTATISTCSQAILAYYDIDHTDPGKFTAASFRSGIEIRDVQLHGTHLTMTIILPMPWNGRRMTIMTRDPARICLPGMTFSSTIAKAAIGRPFSRLVPHPAFDNCPALLVTGVEHDQDTGANATVLYFCDTAEPLDRRPNGAAMGLQ